MPDHFNAPDNFIDHCISLLYAREFEEVDEHGSAYQVDLTEGLADIINTELFHESTESPERIRLLVHALAMHYGETDYLDDLDLYLNGQDGYDEFAPLEWPLEIATKVILERRLLVPSSI